MLTNDLVPCFIQSFSMDSKTGYEKALLVGLFDRTFTCLDHRISASDQAAGPTRRPVAVVMRRDGRLQEVDPWKVVIDDSEEVFEMYSWMWDEESVVCEQLGLAEVKAEKDGSEKWVKRQRRTPALGAGSRLRTIGSTRIRWLAFSASRDTRYVTSA